MRHERRRPRQAKAEADIAARLLDMNVDWAATDPSSGRYSGLFATAPFGELEQRFHQLRAREGGYVEITRRR